MSLMRRSGEEMRDSVNQRATASARKAKMLSPSVQYAIASVLPNIKTGAFWAFTDMKDVKDHVEALRSDKNITVRRIADACLLEVNGKYLLSAITSIDPDALSQQDIYEIQLSRAKAVMNLEKFLISKGKNTERRFGGTVGIYCTNEVSTISYKGVNYPAFCVAITDVLNALGVFGYEIQVGGKFIDAMKAVSAGQVLWDSMKLSPTKTGIFINIRSTFSPEKMKELERSVYKPKYGIK